MLPEQRWLWEPRSREALGLPAELAPIVMPTLYPEERMWLIEPAVVRENR
jgi:hypothetical protein